MLLSWRWKLLICNIFSPFLEFFYFLLLTISALYVIVTKNFVIFAWRIASGD